MSPRPDIGFACNWASPDPRTWSGTPWQLRRAMARHARVVDLPLEPPPVRRQTLRVLCTRYRDGRLVSHWKHAPATQAWTRRRLEALVGARPCDAVLEIGDLAAAPVPFATYQDLSFSRVLAHVDRRTGRAPHFPQLDADRLRRLRDRQRDLYDAATTVFVMSRWLGRALAEDDGVDPAKVVVVPPGISATAGVPVPLRDPHCRRHRLLFVGRDFHTKGGDVVVEAVALVRREIPDVTLTVAGPTTWPLPGSVPDGVTFMGSVPPSALAALYDAHDALLLPSRFEGFGIVLAEALSRGVPCVARDAFAMPEVVRDGHNGVLVDELDAATVAEATCRVLADAEIHERCWAEREAVERRFSWDRAATTIVDTLRGAGR